jgi:pimeloyl-ACP methyl ester carboxylesterase
VRRIAETSIRPVGPGGVADPTRPAGEDVVGRALEVRSATVRPDVPDVLPRHLADITIPVASLHGEASRVVTPEMADRVLSHLRDRAPVVWIPDARHHLVVGQPLAFVVGLRALLAI